MALGDSIYIGTSSGAAIVAVGAYLGPRIQAWWGRRRDNTDLLDGRPEAPGIPALAPIGARVSNTEKKVDALTLNLAALTVTVGEIGPKVDRVLAEFRPNGGNSMRDKVNVLVADKDTQT